LQGAVDAAFFDLKISAIPGLKLFKKHLRINRLWVVSLLYTPPQFRVTPTLTSDSIFTSCEGAADG